MIDLLTDALAVYRATRIITTDAIAQPLRDAAERAGPNIGYLATCDWCSSIHVALFVAAARTFAPRVWRPIGQALAFSAVTGLIAEHT